MPAARMVRLARAIEASRRLLMQERLVHGAWGKTMGTYLNLTQPPEFFDTGKFDLYRRVGSVTHTHHALTALRTYHQLVRIPFPLEAAIPVVNYMANWQIGTGDVPSPVTNLAEGMRSTDPLAPDWPANREYWANMLRHTGTALMSMIRLLDLLDVRPANLTTDGKADAHGMWHTIESKWREGMHLAGECQGSLRRMGELATESLARCARTMAGRILLDDGTWPKFVYSPAYVVVAVHEGNTLFGRHLDQRDREDLSSFEDFLLEHLANRALGGHETYLCQNHHSESCYYYTLVVLDHYLSVIHERIIRDGDRAAVVQRTLRLAERLLLQLATVFRRHDGLPMGLGKSSVDAGTTARFALVTERLRLCLEERGEVLPKELERVVTEAVDTAVEVFESGSGRSDLMTHSFEALVRLVECVRRDGREELRSHLLQLNPLSFQPDSDNQQDDVDAIVIGIIEAAGIDKDLLTPDLVEKLLCDQHFRSAVGEEATVESTLARYSNPIVFFQLLDEAFDENQLLEFCSRNTINRVPGQRKRQIIRMIMDQFEIGAPPLDENETQMAKELLRIERLLRQFIMEIVDDHQRLATRVSEMVQRKRGIDGKDPLYPTEGEAEIWRGAEFSHLWQLISWRWNDVKVHFASEFYGYGEGERKRALCWQLEQLRRIRNRVFHLHGNISAGVDIVDDRRLLETLGAQLSRTLEEAIDCVQRGR